MKRLTSLTILGAALAALTVAPGASLASFSGDNGLIAFERLDRAPGSAERIFTMTAERGLQGVTAVSASGSNPDWSPEGTSIVFERRPLDDPSGYGSELYTVNADGAGLRRLIECLDDCVGDSQPAYSPDGRRIAFVRAFGPLVDGRIPSRRSVLEMSSDGSRVREILSFDVLRDRRIPCDPQWSPDGRRLALTLLTDASVFGVDIGVFTVSLDGSSLRRLVPFTSFDPDWSPDGKRIAFTVSRGGSSPDGVEVYTARPDGTRLRRLTWSGRSRVSAEPVWSPDGTRLAFVRLGRGQRGRSDLYLVRADGSGLTRLTRTPFFEDNPDWGSRPVSSPDS